MRKMLALIASLLLLTLPALALGQTRALLVACHDFLSMPGLGNSVSAICTSSVLRSSARG